MLFFELPIKRYEFRKLKRSVDVTADVSSPGQCQQYYARGPSVSLSAACVRPRKTKLASPRATRGAASQNARARAGVPLARWPGGPGGGRSRAGRRWRARAAPPDWLAGGMRWPPTGVLEAVTGPGTGRRGSAAVLAGPGARVFGFPSRNTLQRIWPKFCSSSAPSRPVFFRFSLQVSGGGRYRRQEVGCMRV